MGDSNWDGFNHTTIKANRYQQTFINGYLDVSGRTIIRHGDLSLNHGNLFVGGKVGIGTNNPEYPLHVGGSALITGNLVVGSGGNIVMRPTFSSSTTVTPNTTSATSDSWTKDGISWNSSASTHDAVNSRFPYKQFNTNSTESAGWGTSTASYSTTSPFGYNGTAISTSVYFPANSRYFNNDNAFTDNTYTTAENRTINGEWLQIAGDNNLIMTQFNVSNDNVGQTPGLYFICGSNDNLTFFPLVNVAYSGTWVGGTTYSNLAIPTTTTVSTTAVTSTASGALSYKYHSYGYGANNYKYFRFIVIAGIGNRLSSGYTSVDGFRYFREWTPTFTVPIDTLTLSSNKTTTNMVVNVGGKVGIGTNNPSVALDVVGNVRCTSGYNLNYTTVPTYSSNQVGYIATYTTTGLARTSTASSGVSQGGWRRFGDGITISVGVWLIISSITYQSNAVAAYSVRGSGVGATTLNTTNTNTDIPDICFVNSSNQDHSIATTSTGWSPAIMGHNATTVHIVSSSSITVYGCYHIAIPTGDVNGTGILKIVRIA